MNSISHLIFPRCLPFAIRPYFFVCRSYQSSLSYEKLFPKAKSLDPVVGPVKTPTKESSADGQFNGYIPIDKLEITQRHARGPGGQHVNKTLTGVEIRFHVDTATWIPAWIKPHFREMNHTRINRDGYFIIFSDETRHRLLNQGQCLDRIRALIREASQVSKGLTDEEKKTIEQRKQAAAEERVIRKRMQSLKKQERKSSTLDLN